MGAGVLRSARGVTFAATNRSRARFNPAMNLRRIRQTARLAAIICVGGITVAQAQESLQRREIVVDGVKREALLYAPGKASTESAPVIFGFHGHGGNMNNAARQYHFQTLWPEAIVIYPQGLNTPGRLTDPEGKKPGWQSGPGDQGDRDLKFFDAMLAELRKNYKVDDKRIYSSGHSNGGGFTYLLWAMRGDQFAAFAPSASAASRSQSLLKPKPVLHVAGENDPLVKFAWQQATMDAVRKLNQCGAGLPWELDKNCTIYRSPIGAPVVTAIHPGTHHYPNEAPEVIVKFFKSQAMK
jgi:polyhydroxybutyrate depolymerase